jgi:hypothetical protein
MPLAVTGFEMRNKAISTGLSTPIAFYPNLLNFKLPIKFSKTMTLKETLAELKTLGNETVRKQNKKGGADDNQFGVKHGDIRTVAKKVKADHPLALTG